ncbi:hypothetical protein SELMODRAFT_421957 [Selaginella moellendorffii]|uniref:Uncharacterized protein n=1 Tax=Selaginella moellendorffii TaxID=88036 RepID=D8SGW7_SELML|nr:hypothetical protein SELMODRAFT_421957 [Selaginella moellendorffii]
MDAAVEKIGDNTGPVFVSGEVPRDRFLKMYNKSRAYKRNMLWKSGSLFIQADYTDHHEQEFQRLGVVFLGSSRQVSLSPGGLMEIGNDRYQQVDLFVLEKSKEDRNLKKARVILAAQVVYRNEDPRAVFDDMEVLVGERGGAKVALGIIVGDPCVVYYRDRQTTETQVIEAIDGNVLRFKWQELFDEVHVEGETVLDLGLLTDHATSV